MSLTHLCFKRVTSVALNWLNPKSRPQRGSPPIPLHLTHSPLKLKLSPMQLFPDLCNVSMCIFVLELPNLFFLHLHIYLYGQDLLYK